jgi:hypothetical protein
VDTIVKCEKAELAQNKVPSDSKWKIIKFIYSKKYIARCLCGFEKEVWIDNVISGKSKQCHSCYGLEKKKNTNFLTHGFSKEKLYNVWCGIKRRCYNKKQESYIHYGAKGITMCNEWRDSYEVFREFALNSGYKEGLEIDRINPEGNYEPSNCQFITKTENIKRATIGIARSFEYKEKISLSKLKLTVEEIDDLIECAISGLFKNSELSKAANIDRHVLTRIVKKYGFTPSWRTA